MSPSLSVLFQAPFQSQGKFYSEPTLPNADITGITTDSRAVKPGNVFVALIGSHTDGHQYLQNALEAGAVALVIDEKRLAQLDVGALSQKAAVWMTPNPYKAYAELSHRWAGKPAEALRLVGVTGTNGKTTVTHLIEKILQDQNRSVGLIGTLGQRSASASVPQTQPSPEANAPAYVSTGHTTPMASELQAILSEMKAAKNEFVVMEVSSHALEQDRVFGCNFEVAVFTNLTQDHLDYHQSMDAYCEAKLKLFSDLHPGQEGNNAPRIAVINLDDAYGKRFVAACPEGVTVLTYGVDNPEATLCASELQFDIDGARFTLNTPRGTYPVQVKLRGLFNVYNVLAALGAGFGLSSGGYLSSGDAQLDFEQVLTSVAQVEGVRGRFEVVSSKPYVIVDYAHTPDGLENVLQAARNVTPDGGRLIAVFGCGGDRDATKRPKMGAITERLADLMVVTSDNPRSEDPQQIITDILSGFQHFNPKTMLVQPDRREAIRQAIDLAQPLDVIVVAGKGHEDYQILADKTIHFDDREEVQTYLSQKQASALSGASV